MDWSVKYVDLEKNYNNYKVELNSVFERILTNGAFILRDDVLKFEENIAKRLNAKFAVGVNSGTDALYLACKVAGISAGDEVITVGHTFVATVAAIHHCEASPILVDIKDDFNIDETKIEERITKNTKAIIPVHLNGRSCNMDKILAIANKYDLVVIEDCAQSVGAKFKDKFAGTFGHFGCFSLHPMKSLNCAGDGGYIVTDNESYYKRLISLRNHGQSADKTDISEYGYSSRLDNLQAAIVDIKLNDLDKNNNIRRNIAMRYNNGLNGLPIKTPKKPEENSDFFDVFNSYVIQTSSDQRDKLVDYLRENGIEVFVHIHKPLCCYTALSLEGNDLSKNEQICREILSLPIYPELSEDKVDLVISKIVEFFK
jgi:dTDP-4-amino-4,6-dideoxygalactose transaminase